MKYTKEEFNSKFFAHIVDGKLYSNYGLRILYYYIVCDLLETERYVKLRDDIKELCLVMGYESLCRLGEKFNPEKSDNPFAYMVQIARSSFAQTIVSETKLRKEEIAAHVENGGSIDDLDKERYNFIQPI